MSLNRRFGNIHKLYPIIMIQTSKMKLVNNKKKNPFLNLMFLNKN